MYQRRLRNAYTPEELAVVYAVPHDHTAWPDHILRVDATIALARAFIDEKDLSAADLSCGNGFILDALDIPTKIYGDYAPGYMLQGPIEYNIQHIQHVDVFIFCETIEHVDDPEATLRAIRVKAHKLILSTPIMTVPDANPEHYWCWDNEAVRAMLTETGWEPAMYHETHPELGYDFQIWGCV